MFLSERRKKEKLEIGMIAMDAIFTPVRKANFEVENMRVGERTDFNRLKINIETDGTMEPEEAFKKAAEILVDQFNLFLETETPEGKEESGEEKKEEKEEKEGDDSTKIKIDEMKLSTRTMNALSEAGIKTLGGLAKKSEASLKEIEGMGEKGIKEIKKVLKKYGFEIK